MKVVALVGDLMDRSRLSAAVPGIEFVSDPESVADADVVVLDLARHAEWLAAVRQTAATARVVAYGPHVDEQSQARARAEGADDVMPRSRFFRDPAGAVAGRT